MAGGLAGSDVMRFQNSLVDLMLVVGLDENTGLIPGQKGVSILTTTVCWSGGWTKIPDSFWNRKG
jgi:hypothetical protein